MSPKRSCAGVFLRAAVASTSGLVGGVRCDYGHSRCDWGRWRARAFSRKEVARRVGAYAAGSINCGWDGQTGKARVDGTSYGDFSVGRRRRYAYGLVW